ncbi:hypothetical protein HPP92_002809 [Vanilla planifolia]|uniref:Enoyl reductase (ER) domain-containing protein n=1 Tax=Vanilla planifolia TaxID=51239 RepID=A0A835SEF6_VANPL|nr:hypothetical protein HPP92_002809 [Vanilla planifolia]
MGHIVASFCAGFPLRRILRLHTTRPSMATAKTMRAVQYAGYGGGAAALKHVEIPLPSPKKGELLLKIEAAAINPFDWKVQNGALRPFLPSKFPFTPGVDVTGEIVEIGPEVNSLKKGDKVVSLLSVTTGGGLAEYAVASSTLTALRPSSMPPATAAALPTAALTALQALRSAGVKTDSPSNPPTNILITAASGGVGHFAVQLAKLAGVHVTATCGARNVDLVRSLGADEVLDYKSSEGAALRSPSGKKYDAVVHCATGVGWSAFQPNLAAAARVIDITPGGRAYLTWVLQKVTFSKQRLVPMFLSPEKGDLELVMGLVEQKRLRTVIDSRYPLEMAEEAWAKSMAGHATGKIKQPSRRPSSRLHRSLPSQPRGNAECNPKPLPRTPLTTITITFSTAFILLPFKAITIVTVLFHTSTSPSSQPALASSTTVITKSIDSFPYPTIFTPIPPLLRCPFLLLFKIHTIPRLASQLTEAAERVWKRGKSRNPRVGSIQQVDLNFELEHPGEEKEEEEDSEEVFVLTDEWREFFAKSEAKRRMSNDAFLFHESFERF